MIIVFILSIAIEIPTTSYEWHKSVFSPDSKYLLFVQWDKPNTVYNSLWIYNIRKKEKKLVKKGVFRYLPVEEGILNGLVGMIWYNDTTFLCSLNGDGIIEKGIIKGSKIITKEMKKIPPTIDTVMVKGRKFYYPIIDTLLEVHNFSFSPDKKYFGFIQGVEDDSRLWLYEIKKDKLIPVLPNVHSVDLGGYIWSPDKRHIAVASPSGKFPGIYVLDVGNLYNPLKSVILDTVGYLRVIRWDKDGLIYSKITPESDTCWDFKTNRDKCDSREYYLWDGKKIKRVSYSPQKIIYDKKREKAIKVSYKEFLKDTSSYYLIAVSPDSTYYVFSIEEEDETSIAEFHYRLILVRNK